MGFAQNFATGFGVGRDIGKTVQANRRRKGMAAALSDVQEPAIPTEQQQMLSDQTADFAPEDAAQYMPTTTDWIQLRRNGAKKILDSGGSMEDVVKFQQYVDQTQKQGLEQYGTAAAVALEQGDPDTAARYLETAYSYLPDSLTVKATNVDGQLLAFPMSEKDGQLVAQPVPVTPEYIRKQLLALTDNNAFLAFAEDNKRWKEDSARKNKTAAAQIRANDVRAAETEQKLRTPEYGVLSSKGAQQAASAVGWKTADLTREASRLNDLFTQFNADNYEKFTGIPTTLADVYGVAVDSTTDMTPEEKQVFDANLRKVQQAAFGILETNPGIPANTALREAEELVRIVNKGKDYYAKYFAKNAKEDPNSPSGYSVRIDKRKINLPVFLAPDGGARAEQWAKRKNLPAGAVTYLKRPAAGLPEWYKKKYGIKDDSPVAVAPPPAVAQQPALPPQAQATAGPAPSQQAALPPQAQPPAQAAASQGVVTPPPPIGNLSLPTSALPQQAAGSPGLQNLIQREQGVVDGVAAELEQYVDPQTGQLDIPWQRAKVLVTQLAGLDSPPAVQLRDNLLNYIKQARQQGVR